MATQNPINLTGLKAGADLSSSQYLAVKLNAANQVILVAATTDIPLGILQNNPKNTEEAVVAIGGTSKWIAGGVVTNNTIVATKADGKAQTAVATQHPIGLVVGDTTAADGDITIVAVARSLVVKA